MLNRRSFLKTAGLATAETLGGRNPHAVAETQGEATGPATIPGTPEEPVRVLNGNIDLDRHDGGLSPAVGVELVQVMRANRTHPEWAEDFGFTYNHAPMICYWNGKFHVEWLSNTYGEQTPPGHTLVATSADGRTWSKGKVVFPIYYFDVPPFRNSTSEPGMAIMHQRMGFY